MIHRDRRRRRVTEFIAAGGVHSQEQLRELLESEGIEATQATLSRDLRELGVVKGSEGYTLPGSGQGLPAPRSTKELERALRDHLQTAQTAGTLVVLRTAPGHAQALAVVIDAVRLPEVVGTLAGDDTLFMATKSNTAAESLTETLSEMAGL